MTALPAKSAFTDVDVTEGAFKTSLDNLRDYLAESIGETGGSIRASVVRSALSATLGPLTGRNLLIGNFFVNQRAVSGSVVLSAGVYGHDRFKAGTGGCSYTFATSNGVPTVTISAGTLVQVVEATNIVAGDYILSHAGTAQVQIDGGGYGDSGAVTATLNGSANATVEYGTGTLSLPQMELGTIVTAYDRRKVSEELTMCQFYYEECAAFGVSYGSSGSSIQRFSASYTVNKRVTPTVAVTKTSGSASGGAAITISKNACFIGFSSSGQGQDWIGAIKVSAEI